MAPKAKLTRADIVGAAIEIIRREGAEGLNARALAAELGCSTQPVFSNFSSMEELKGAVIAAALEIYQDFLGREMRSGKYPPYKAGGIGYIRFAKEEKALFRMLFMSDRSGEKEFHWDKSGSEFIAGLQKSLGISAAEAERFHTESWMFIHGIAVTIATSYLSWDFDEISEMMTEVFNGLKRKYEK